MPVEATDVPQFVGLAERLRRETYGCKVWDRDGAEVVFARTLVGLNFVTALELVMAHACDPDAKTPGAINRKFKPDLAPPPAIRPTAANQCRECGMVAGQCHPSCPGTSVRQSVPSRAETAAALKAAALAQMRPTGTFPGRDPEPRPDDDPAAPSAARAALRTDPSTEENEHE